MILIITLPSLLRTMVFFFGNHMLLAQEFFHEKGVLNFIFVVFCFVLFFWPEEEFVKDVLPYRRFLF